MSRARRAAGLLGLVLVGFVAGLAIAEGIARLLERESAPPARPPVAAGLPELVTLVDLAQPNARGVHNGALYTANGAGFRGREYARPKPPGVFRIVVAGDSVTMGSGVGDDEAYPQLLEVALAARGGPWRYEVLNLGLIGLDVHQVLDRLQAVGLAYEPDLIVYGCTLNDIKGPDYRESVAWLGRLSQKARYERFATSPSHLLRLVWPHWQSFQDLVHPTPGTPLWETLDNYQHNPPAWSRFVAGLARLAELASGAHARAVVFLHTPLEYLNPFHPYRPVYRRIAAAAASLGLPVIESFPLLRGHDEQSLWVSRNDAHPNAIAHRLLAQALLDGLEALPPGWLPAADGATDPRRATLQ